MAGVGGLLAGGLRPRHITLFPKQIAEIRRSLWSGVGLTGIGGPLVSRPRVRQITVLAQQCSEAHGC